MPNEHLELAIFAAVLAGDLAHTDGLLQRLSVRELRDIRSAADTLRWRAECEEQEKLSKRPSIGDWKLPEGAAPFAALPANTRFSPLRGDGSPDGVVWVKQAWGTAIQEDPEGDPLDMNDWELVMPLPDLSDDHVVEVLDA